MSSRITHINCPQCGGTLGAPSGNRIVSCHYCGQSCLVRAEGQIPGYYIRPVIDPSGARHALAEILNEPATPAGLVKDTRLQSASLYFMPFYEFTGHRIGTFTTGSKDERYGGVKIKQDTRVIMSDFISSMPAVNIPEWGLNEVQFDHIRSERDGVLHPFERSKIERLGRVFDPEMSVEKALELNMMRVDLRDSSDNTKVSELKSKLIHYPVWRLRFSYKGRAFGASVDGVTGHILSARLPLAERGRIIWMLLTSGLVSLLAAKIIRLGILIAHSGNLDVIAKFILNTSIYLAPLYAIILAIVFTIVAFGWDQFRYSSELEIKGTKRQVFKINRPDKTVLDGIRDKFISLSEFLLKNSYRYRIYRYHG